MKSSGFLVRIRAHLLQLSGVGDGSQRDENRLPSWEEQLLHGSWPANTGVESNMGGSEHVPRFNMLFTAV